MTRRADLLEAHRALSARWLGRRRAARSPGARVHTIRAASRLARTNVHGLGIGWKVVDGRETSTLCVRIHVVQKLATTVIAARDRLPSTIDGVPTDVIESPVPTLLRRSRRDLACSDNRHDECRPIFGGISASHRDVLTGTIACICRSTEPADEAGARFVLSNSHVFAARAQAKAGDPILQPARNDGGLVSASRIAALHRWFPIAVEGTEANRIDAAIARLDDEDDFDAEICGIGSILGVESGALDMPVRKHGSNTGYTEGVIVETDYRGLVGLDEFDPTLQALFAGQYRIDPTARDPVFAAPGDSGSLVVHGTRRRAVGLLFAVSGASGLANPITEVFERLRIDLA